MKKLCLLLFISTDLHCFAQDVAINDANAEKRNITGSFDAIHVSDGIELLLSYGDEESVAVGASDPKYLEKLKTEVSDGTLNIYFERKTLI